MFDLALPGPLESWPIYLNAGCAASGSTSNPAECSVEQFATAYRFVLVLAPHKDE